MRSATQHNAIPMPRLERRKVKRTSNQQHLFLPKRFWLYSTPTKYRGTGFREWHLFPIELTKWLPTTFPTHLLSIKVRCKPILHIHWKGDFSETVPLFYWQSFRWVETEVFPLDLIQVRTELMPIKIRDSGSLITVQLSIHRPSKKLIRPVWPNSLDFCDQCLVMTLISDIGSRYPIDDYRLQRFLLRNLLVF